MTQHLSSSFPCLSFVSSTVRRGDYLGGVPPVSVLLRACEGGGRVLSCGRAQLLKEREQLSETFQPPCTRFAKPLDLAYHTLQLWMTERGGG